MAIQCLLLLVSIGGAISGHVHKCNTCKTENAAEVFANFHCDEIPATAPDCTLIGHGRFGFQQICPANSHCLTITSQAEELRVCTQKGQVGTITTTDGIVMTVCGSDMCNSAEHAAGRPALAVLLLPLTAVLSQLW